MNPPPEKDGGFLFLELCFLIIFVNNLDIDAFLKENGVHFGGVPERSKGSDCKSDGSAFEGSNPSPSTS